MFVEYEVNGKFGKETEKFVYLLILDEKNI